MGQDMKDGMLILVYICKTDRAGKGLRRRESGLGTTAVVMDGKRGWREKPEEMYADRCFSSIIPAAESGE